MNRQVSAIAGRLSLRAPQRHSLEILDRVTELVPPKKGTDLDAALAAIRAEFPTVTDFEREFPSLCFALATGVGKTRLMGAFISYLSLAHGLRNFFVLAPNLTIYNKLIADFTPNTPKYVFKGIAEFVTETPVVITGENYEQAVPVRTDMLPGFGVHINIFNISKINSEVRGGKSPRIKRLSEYIGQSYFDYLAGLDDLALIMDESHRYRASAGIRAINELKPVIGLELTATPFIETNRGPVQFKNVIYDYPLGRAMADGFVKEPAVATRKDFNPAGMEPGEIERMKLEDGISLHESVKVELATYAQQAEVPTVKPFLLIIARDTTHAGQLLKLIQSDEFFDGRYKEKVIQVDSSKTGADEEEMIQRLLKVEHADEPTEIVIHVNMLKEGWDVTNLYTIVPLRAANAKILIEQSIGRGLRLPYGRRTGVPAVDRLSIVAHDKFQEIVDEANKADSTIRLQTIIFDPAELGQKSVTVVSRPLVEMEMGMTAPVPGTGLTGAAVPVPMDPEERRIAKITFDAIRKFQSQPQKAPTTEYLSREDIQQAIVKEVQAQYMPVQMELEVEGKLPDVPASVLKNIEIYTQRTIQIPRIVVSPKTEVKSGFHPFTLDLTALNYPPVSKDLWVQYLRTGEVVTLQKEEEDAKEERLEDYIVAGLMDFDDISYEQHSEFLYDLAAQAVAHFKSYLPEADIGWVLQYHRRPIARHIYVQMQKHFWEDDVEYEVTVSKGFTDLIGQSFTQVGDGYRLDFRHAPPDRVNIARYLFTGFSRCLFAEAKFQSDTERKLAIIIDRDSQKWFRPAKKQFQIYYRDGIDNPEYQPDFVAECEDAILMLESKARNEMESPAVQAKRTAAEQWCRNATDHALAHGGKPWRYALIPHDAIAENMSLRKLLKTES